MRSKAAKRQAKRERQKAKREAVKAGTRRIGPTPETRDKLQRDALQDLLGCEDGGLDAGTVEALLEIEAAYHIIEGIVGSGGPVWIGDRAGHGGGPEITDSAARWWAIWNTWATEFWRRTRRVGIGIAVIVEARKPVDGETLALLRTAAGLWDRTRREYDDARRVERNARHTIMGPHAIECARA